MIYEIYRSIGEKAPVILDDVYYSLFCEEYFILACRMIVENGKYRFEGKDEEIEKKLTKLLEIEPRNHLVKETSGSFIDSEGIEVFWDGHEKVEISHPDFQTALRECAAAFGYTVNPKNFDFQFIKVDSLADVRRVKREYEEKNGLQEAA